MYCRYCGHKLAEGEQCDCPKEQKPKKKPGSLKKLVLILVVLVLLVVIAAGGIFLTKKFLFPSGESSAGEVMKKQETDTKNDTELSDMEDEEESSVSEKETQSAGGMKKASVSVVKIQEKYGAGTLDYAGVRKALNAHDIETLEGEEADVFLELSKRLKEDLTGEMVKKAEASDFSGIFLELKKITDLLPDDSVALKLQESYEADYILYLQNKSNELTSGGKKEDALKLLEEGKKLLPESAVLDELMERIKEDTQNAVHRYDYIVKDCTWEEAQKACIEKGGYLAQINSSEELYIITDEAEKKGYDNMIFFLGGRRDLKDHKYYWVDRENNLVGEILNDPNAWCNSIWLKGEPSFEDQKIEEHCMMLFYHKDGKRWVWNDVPNDILKAVPEYSSRVGYICEYE